MAGSEPLLPLEPRSAAQLGRRTPPRVPPAGRVRRLTTRDRLTIVLMLVVPLFLTVTLVVLPAVATVLLSFTNWNGIGDLSTIKWIGFQNYVNVTTNYPPFWP